jgi:hypothetical protein
VAQGFPHDSQRSTDAPDTALLCRQLLTREPDRSVTLIEAMAPEAVGRVIEELVTEPPRSGNPIVQGWCADPEVAVFGQRYGSTPPSPRRSTSSSTSKPSHRRTSSSGPSTSGSWTTGLVQFPDGALFEEITPER